MVIKKRRNENSGFTLTEIMIVVGIFVVLTGLVTAVLLKVRGSAKSVVCLSNLKQIATAIQMYNSDYKVMPNTIYPILKDSGYITTAGMFKCPVDLTTDPDSYGPFYLPRQLTDSQNSQKLFLGCPRHADKAIALFGWPQFNIARACKVLWNGSPVRQGTVVNGGELLFEDGTRVVINGTLPVGVMLSTVDQNKQIYSAISVREGDLGNGSLTVTHDGDSKFDVLTPSLITGVAGTVFTVTVQWPDTSNPALCKTIILCPEGKVLVEELATGKTYTIGTDETTKTTTATNAITPKPTFSTPSTPGRSHWVWKWWKY